jgi:RNA polymerase sigma-70 factor, ECF subfamily
MALGAADYALLFVLGEHGARRSRSEPGQAEPGAAGRAGPNLLKNGIGPAFVWNHVMLTRTVRAIQPTLELREGDLGPAGTGEAGQRFLRLANAELDRAYRLAGMILGDRIEAEDATQDALLRAWRSAASLRDPNGFQAWFDRILVNICRDRLRRRRRIVFSPLDLDGPQADRPDQADPFRALLDRDQVVRAMAGLNPDERLVVVLHYWADLTLDGVAERLGWPVGTVKSRLHHALNEIRRVLDTPGGDSNR